MTAFAPSTGPVLPESPHGGRAAGDLMRGSSPGSGRPNPTRGACAAAGSDGNGLPCAHSCLAVVASMRYLPKTSPCLLAQRTGSSRLVWCVSRTAGQSPAKIIPPFQSHATAVPRLAPVRLARFPVAACQESGKRQSRALLTTCNPHRVAGIGTQPETGAVGQDRALSDEAQAYGGSTSTCIRPRAGTCQGTRGKVACYGKNHG